MSVPRSERKKPQCMLPNPETRHWTCQVKAEIRLCPPLTPLTDPFANPRTAAFTVPRQQRDQSTGEHEPERPHCERMPGGNGVSAREAHGSAHNQHPRALTVHAPLPNRQHKEHVYGMNAHSKSLLLLARHFWVIKYWQTTPNKTRTVSHRAHVKTQMLVTALFGQAF